ncbi:MAG: 2-polyprenyl-3-methyl-5-hydroxy-6-metoxy,4-benzoquinol methylase [Alphaproteobacteria bacterium]|nr:2-polyprenyl-3-methyl-5-hydroxy-6-metoxy,4-benzoquinol methylase [Alphaproteobacteria bacterium]
MSGNIDRRVVEGFGREWAAYDQTSLDAREFTALYDGYFGIFPFADLPEQAEGFDLGCGSGRWASAVVTRPGIGVLHCIDPSSQAISVARRRLAVEPKARFHVAAADTIPLPDSSQDFGYSLGVLHHIPDTSAALADCVKKLKPGAPFLVYLYYSMDNKPGWYRKLWAASDLIREGICRLPFPIRRAVTTALAAFVYWPLARSAALAERAGRRVSNLPLSAYRHASFYTMRTDSLDRFGTRLEQRFSRAEIAAMMTEAGLGDIRFSEQAPYWVACGRKRG